MGDVMLTIETNAADLNMMDSIPKTLYVSRKVKNASDIVSWAKSQGYTNITPAKDMHVTIAYSKTPINWMNVSEAWQSELTIQDGGPRDVDQFGDNASVLLIKCSELEWRHNSIKDAGASWDWPEYQPHITISYSKQPEFVTPYQGKIILGPEIFEEIKENWSADLNDSDKSATHGNMTHKFSDAAAIGTTKRTHEGYLIARSRVARTGVQGYMASEIDVDPLTIDPARQIIDKSGKVIDAIVKVYRSPKEVFDAKSLESLTRAPVTIDHPAEMVDANNWSKYAKGEIGDRYKADIEDGWISVDPMIKDHAASIMAETTHKQWSAGYTAKLVLSNTDFADYDMVDIRFNHLAAVPRARAGSRASIGDSAANQWGAAPLTTSKEVSEMEMKAVAIGDKAIQVAATDADTLKTMIDVKDAAIGELKAQLADAQSKILTDEQMQAKVKDLADAMARREAVKAKFGDEAIKDASDAEIAGMFKVIDKAPGQDDTARKALADAMKEKSKEKSPWDEVITKKKEGK